MSSALGTYSINSLVIYKKKEAQENDKSFHLLGLTQSTFWQHKTIKPIVSRSSMHQKQKPTQPRMRNITKIRTMLNPLQKTFYTSRVNIIGNAYLPRYALAKQNTCDEPQSKLKFALSPVFGNEDLSTRNNGDFNCTRRSNYVSYGPEISFSIKEEIKPSMHKTLEPINNKGILESIKKWKTSIVKEKKTQTLKVRMLRIVSKMKLLGLLPYDFRKGNIFCTESYEKPYSKEFISAVKTDSTHEAKKYLELDKFLVYAYDHTKKTALHWATIRCHYKMMLTLLKWHSDADAKDMSSKCALNYAVYNEDLLASILLISQNATIIWGRSVYLQHH